MYDLWQFMAKNADKLLEQTIEHVGITLMSLLLATLVSIPAGIYIARRPRLSSPVLGFTGILQTVPSIALLGFLLPVLGIGVKPAVFALFLYALLPIVRNTFTGIREVEGAVIEAAKGMGMTPGQILRKVELPLAMPVIFAGIRTATVINVGVATLAAYIGAGGLGEFIFGGIALNNGTMILAGAIPAAVLAILFDQALALLQKLPARRLVKTAAGTVTFLLLGSLAFSIPQYFRAGITAGFDTEFYGRQDGYQGLRQRYGLEFNTVLLNSALMYEAVKENYVDIISGYATDGRIKAYDLVVLEDDKNAFPPYFCVPLINEQTATEHPEVVDVLQLLGGLLNDSTMTELNYQVDFLKKAPEEVARQFLEEHQLWKPDRTNGGTQLVIGSKIFTEQYILVELFSQLINGYTDLDTDLKTGLGGTKICFDALREGEIDIYPEYTGTGFMVILQPTESVIQERIADPNAVYDYVKQAFATDFNIRWLKPLGFNNAYAIMAKRAVAEVKAWETISDL